MKITAAILGNHFMIGSEIPKTFRFNTKRGCNRSPVILAAGAAILNTVSRLFEDVSSSGSYISFAIADFIKSPRTDYIVNAILTIGS